MHVCHVGMLVWGLTVRLAATQQLKSAGPTTNINPDSDSFFFIIMSPHLLSDKSHFNAEITDFKTYTAELKSHVRWSVIQTIGEVRVAELQVLAGTSRVALCAQWVLHLLDLKFEGVE